MEGLLTLLALRQIAPTIFAYVGTNIANAPSLSQIPNNSRCEREILLTYSTVKLAIMNEDDLAEHKFGCPLPFSEPAWYDSRNGSPYYTDAHKEFRAKMRTFVDTEVTPNVELWYVHL